jgi:hypothetical protein
MKDTRVNIQYSIDLQDLPEEVSRLIDNSTSFLEVALEDSQYLSEKEDHLTLKTLEEINSLRMSLSKVDYILDDITKIVGGYLRMTMDPSTEEAQTTQRHEDPSPTNPFVDSAGTETTISELQQKLSDFTERIGNEESAEITVE